MNLITLFAAPFSLPEITPDPAQALLIFGGLLHVVVLLLLVTLTWIHRQESRRPQEVPVFGNDWKSAPSDPF